MSMKKKSLIKEQNKSVLMIAIVIIVVIAVIGFLMFIPKNDTSTDDSISNDGVINDTGVLHKN